MYEVVIWWDGGMSEEVVATNLTYDEALAIYDEIGPDSECGEDGTDIRKVE